MNDEAKPPVALKDVLLRIFLGTAGGGAGVILAMTLLETLRGDPKLFGELLKAWGPAFVLAVGLLWTVREQGGQNRELVRVQQEVVSTQRATKEALDVTLNAFANAAQVQAVRLGDMSEALHRLANKDNELLLRLEARIDETSDRTRRIIEWIEREEERVRTNAPHR